MNTPTPPQTFFEDASHATPVFDNDAEGGMATDASSANKLSADQQLLRFLQWLQFTDRGHQPC